MTAHELLAFLDSMHSFMEETVAKPGPWCWPERDLLRENLLIPENRRFWGPKVSAELHSTLSTLKAKHWAVEEGCVEHCHARHVKLTATGMEALKLMNEEGCERHYLHKKARVREQCQRDGFRFRRKKAAA